MPKFDKLAHDATIITGIIGNHSHIIRRKVLVFESVVFSMLMILTELHHMSAEAATSYIDEAVERAKEKFADERHRRIPDE